MTKALAIVLALATGCVSTTHNRAAMAADLAMFAAGATLATTAGDARRDFDRGVGISIALAATAATLANFSVAPRDVPALPAGVRGPVVITVREPVDPELHGLTVQAADAAVAGRCADVRDIAARVGRLDPRYRDDGFVHTREVARCLGEAPSGTAW